MGSRWRNNRKHSRKYRIIMKLTDKCLDDFIASIMEPVVYIIGIILIIIFN